MVSGDECYNIKCQIFEGKFLWVDQLQIYMESDLFSGLLLCHGLLLAIKLDVQVSFGVVGHCSLLV